MLLRRALVLAQRHARRVPQPWRALSAVSGAPQPTPHELYGQIVQRFEASALPPRTALHDLLLGASTRDEGALAVSAYRMYARKDRPPLPAQTTALLLKAAVRTRQFEPVVGMLESSKWYGLAPTDSQLQALAVALEAAKDWERLERVWRVRVSLRIVSSVDALRSAQLALLAQGKLQAALKVLRPDRPLTARFVRPYMYAAVQAACADAGRHAQAKQGWAQLLSSGLAPTPRCLVETLRALLTDAEGGAAAAAELFAAATDPATSDARAVIREEALAAAALKLPGFTAEHLAEFGGKEAVAAAPAAEEEGVAELEAAAQAQTGGAGADGAAAPQGEEGAAREAAGKEEQAIKDGRNDSLI